MARPTVSDTASIWLLLIAATLTACGNDRATAPTEPSEPGTTSFTSKIPDADSSDLGASTGGTSTGGAAAQGGGDSGEDPARLISEADVIRVQGNTLFALSKYSGLSAIDITDPSELKLLGSHSENVTPFEMYIEGDRGYLMYTGWGHYNLDEETGNHVWQKTSRIQALDLSNPAEISVIGEYDVPGEVTDSRKVGDVLYLVTFENGHCWQCENTVNTRVASFDVSMPNQFQLIDELRLRDTSADGGTRSIAVTEDRIYISGRDWGGADTGVINVVDISDPKGDLVEGAEVTIAGPIDSRWQIDELDGILRVISQPGGWGGAEPPQVQTFAIAASNDIKPLAALDMTLPPDERLLGVRFDGPRAYANTHATNVQTTPVYTFDLSDPGDPKQVGQLVIPGWGSYIEPRGDRIYALGLLGSAEDGGALHVSLFDVSDLSAPTQLAQVHFGGQSAGFTEDQDRIAKAFNMMADEGLILVPFVGWDEAEGEAGECSHGTYVGGIQLIDAAPDTLTLRGLAPQDEPRRGFLAKGALFGVSDNSVQTFDISDRDAPKALSTLKTASGTSKVRVMGDHLLRFGVDWGTKDSTLDVTTLDAASSATPLAELDLTKVAAYEESCKQVPWDNQVLVQGDYAYIPSRGYSWDPVGMGFAYQEITFYIADIRDPAKPQITGTFQLRENPKENLTQVIKTDSALLVGRYTGLYSFSPSGEPSSRPTFAYDVISLADPANPKLTSTIEVPETLAFGGYGYLALCGYGRTVSHCSVDTGWGWWDANGPGETLASGDLVISQHQEATDDGSGLVRYYMDRIDVSDPSSPKLLTKVNVPGSVIDFDAATGRAVTLDYLETTAKGASGDDCSRAFGANASWSFDSARGLCVAYRRALYTLKVEADVATLVDSMVVDDTTWASKIAVTKNRVFATYQGDDLKAAKPRVRVFSVGASGSKLGKLEDLGSVEVDSPGDGPLFARGEHALFFRDDRLLQVVDAQDPDALSVVAHEVRGRYGVGLEMADGFAYCGLDPIGVQTIPLD